MQVARKAIQQFLQKRQGLQKCQDAPSQFGSGGRGGHAGLAAGIGGKLRRQRDAQNAHQAPQPGPLEIAAPGIQPIQHRLGLMQYCRQHPCRRTDGDEEREGGLVLFEGQAEHGGGKGQRGKLKDQHSASQFKQCFDEHKQVTDLPHQHAQHHD